MSSLICDASTGKSIEEDDKKKDLDDLKQIKKQMDEEENNPRRGTKPPIKFKRMKIKFDEKEIEDKRKLYESVVVQDFGDIYHMTDEERKADNELYEMFTSIQQVKTKYRKLDQLVIAYRKILNVVKAIAKQNTLVVDEEKFINDVLSNKIILYGIRFPKYSVPKKKRKETNWELVSQYILDDSLDPKDLVQQSNDYYEWDKIEEDPEESMQDVFGMTFEEFMEGNNLSNDHGPVDFDTPEEYIGENVIIPEDRLQLIKLRRKDKDLGNFLKDITQGFKKASQFDSETRRFDSYIWNSTYSDLDEIRDMDEDRNLLKKKKYEPEFNGHFMDSDSVHKYLYDADEYLKTHEKVRDEYSGKYITVQEYEESELSNYLEECGWNIRKLYNIEEEMRKVKRKVKSDEKRNKKIRKSIIEADERKKKRVVRRGFEVVVENDDEKGVNSKKKKKSKKEKKRRKHISNMLPKSSDFDDYERMMKGMYED